MYKKTIKVSWFLRLLGFYGLLVFAGLAVAEEDKSEKEKKASESEKKSEEMLTDAELKAKAKAEDAKKIAEKAEKQIKGQYVPRDVGLFATGGVSIYTSYAKELLNNDEILKVLDENEKARNAGKAESMIPSPKYGEKWKRGQLHGKANDSVAFNEHTVPGSGISAGLALNKRLFDVTTALVSFKFVKKHFYKDWFHDSHWNKDDRPAFTVYVSPYEFIPLTSDVFFKLFGIESDRNIGKLSYGISYGGGLIYNKNDVIESRNNLSYLVAHDNFDPLGPVELPYGLYFRGSLSSSVSAITDINTKADKKLTHYVTFESTPNFKVGKFFDNKKKLIIVNFYAPVVAPQIPINKKQFNLSNINDQTRMYQFVRLTYDHRFSSVSSFAIHLAYDRDYPDSIPKKKAWTESLHQWVGLSASISLNI